MTEEQATKVANALQGQTWNSGGGLWLVKIPNHEGQLIVISDYAIAIYDGEDEFEEGDAVATYSLY